jgi:tetratricopeptide (TPR) repeat protein
MQILKTNIIHQPFLLSRVNLSIVIFLFLGGCSVMQPLQKRKLIGVFHLIETARYADAKTVSEELINDVETAQWPRTWYARGVLFQNAYREGIRKNDRKLTELYPDQLTVTLESFNKALELDESGRMEKQLAPRYVVLANDLQVLGEKHFRDNKFREALHAFENALRISERPMLEMRADTNLIFNAGLAAFEMKDWDTSIKYFGRLHNYQHSANIAHLLYLAHLNKGDTIAAKNTLKQGVEDYNNNEELVLLLANLHFSSGDTTATLGALNKAIGSSPDNHIFYYTTGLIYQKAGQFNKAIEAYSEAVRLAPDGLMAYVNIATSYYNIGIEIDENARAIMNSAMVRTEKEKSAEAFEEAIVWLDKAYEKDPKDQEVIRRLYEMYKTLRITAKALTLERKIR